MQHATPKLHVSVVLVLGLELAGFPPVGGEWGDVLRVLACSLNDICLYIRLCIIIVANIRFYRINAGMDGEADRHE